MGLGFAGVRQLLVPFWAGWGVTLVAQHTTEVTETAAWRRHSGGVKPGDPGGQQGKRHQP